MPMPDKTPHESVGIPVLLPSAEQGTWPGPKSSEIDAFITQVVGKYAANDLAKIVNGLLKVKPDLWPMIESDANLNPGPCRQCATMTEAAEAYKALADKQGSMVYSHMSAVESHVQPAIKLEAEDVNINQGVASGGAIIPVRASSNAVSAPSNGPPPVMDGLPSSTENEVSIIQFSTAIYYVREDEGKLTVDVVRLGSSVGSSSVSYTTEDVSARAGIKYIHQQGILHFAAGETMKQLYLQIMQDEIWDATLEFKIILSDAKGAQLGRYLYTARVRIIDDDAFPTNKYKQFVVKDDLDSIPKAKLMIEYFKMNFTNPTVRRGGLQMIIADFVQNLYSVFRLWLGLYLVDYVLNSDYDANQLIVPGNRTQSLVVSVCGLVFPYVLVHYLQIARRFWKVGGTARKTLQANLLRKFLNYEETVRKSLKQSDVMIAMTRDTEELVEHGFIQSFSIVQSCSRLLLLLGYQTLIISHDLASFGMVLLPTVILPAVMFSFLSYRNKKTREAKHNCYTAQGALLSHVDQTVDSARLIIDYHRRPVVLDKFTQWIQQYNDAEVVYSAIMVTNHLLAPWSAIIINAVFVVFGGLWVLDGKMPIGEFLTHCAVFREIGELWQAIYDDLLVIYSAVPALEHITRYMNLPTDVEKRRILNRQRREIGTQQHAAARKHLTTSLSNADLTGTGSRTGGQVFAADIMKISMEEVHFHYTAREPDKGADLHDCSFEVPQGSLVAVIGRRGQGKTTMLKVLASVLLAEKGKVFVPPQLRVFHIEQDSSFIEGTLLENLTFGCNEGDPDAELERVMAICQRLGVRDTVLQHLRDQSVNNWKEIFSLTECMLLHIARGLVANPEVLVIHKPTLVFDDAHAVQVFAALRAFVDEKGLEQDPSQWCNRRPRTLFCTFSRASGLQVADKVLLCTSHGTRMLSKEEVTEDLLC